MEPNSEQRETAQATSQAPPTSQTTHTATATGRTGKLNIDRDVRRVKGCLKNLDKEELKDLFQELGLFDQTVRNRYSDSSRAEYSEELVRAWILGRDGVLLDQEGYEGGATWENLRKALIELNHIVDISDNMGPECSSCTWRAVYDTLRHPTVDHNATAEKLKTQLEQWRKERKRKAPSQGGVKSKKVKFDESTITVEKGPPCPTTEFDSATTHGDCVYFANGDNIYPFNASSKRWMQQLECPHGLFGLATVENELVAVGGLVIEEEKEEEKNCVHPINKVLSFSLDKERTWTEKYPEMKEARVRPEVVVFGKYLIVLGGVIRDPDLRPVTSVEVLDLEEKRWYTINLPEEFSSMKWLSACICGEDIYIAVRHDDPDFRSRVAAIPRRRTNPYGDAYSSDDDDDYDDDYSSDDGDYDPPSPWPCYSLYRCSVEALVKSAKESNHPNNQLFWETLQHLHPSVCLNEKKACEPIIGYKMDGPYEIPIVEAEMEYLAYKVCRFALSHINNTLVAVGCRHVASVSCEDNNHKLYLSYRSYRETEKYRNDHIIYHRYFGTSNDQVDTECHIYIYDTTDYSWKRVKTTTENGASNYKPTVAVVDNKLVIVRESEHIHIVNFP